MTIAGASFKFVSVESQLPGAVPNGAMFFDSSNANKLSIKRIDGQVFEINLTGGGVEPYFVNYLNGETAALISIGNNINIGSGRLAVFKNGQRLANSLSVGVASDRYQETTVGQITLGAAAVASDVLSFVNRFTTTSSSIITGITGSVLTVPSYTMGDKSLVVYRNGILMNASGLGNSNDQYNETTSTTITLGLAALPSDFFIVELINPPISRQDQSGVTGLTLTLSSPYTMADEKLLVYRNGVLMINSNSPSLGGAVDRYQEGTTTTLILETAAVVGDVFTYMNQS